MFTGYYKLSNGLKPKNYKEYKWSNIGRGDCVRDYQVRTMWIEVMRWYKGMFGEGPRKSR